MSPGDLTHNTSFGREWYHSGSRQAAQVDIDERHSANVTSMKRHLQHLRCAPSALAFLLVTGVFVGCDDTPGPVVHPEPGLEILTPRLGVSGGARATLLLRSDQPARVSIFDGDIAIGHGRSGRDTTKIRFTVPEGISIGVATTIRVSAVSEGGMTDDEEVTLEGLGPVNSWDLTEDFSGIAALGNTAVLLSPTRLWTVTPEDEAPTMSDVSGDFTTITADEERNAVVVADRSARISSYTLSIFGELNLTENFQFAIYDGSSPPEEVTAVNALHVNGALVAAATGQGMALMDRDAVDGEETYCRRRSAMTAKLEPAIFDPSMLAVVVTSTERVVAGGSYLNVYEAYEDNDPGDCDPPLPDRGTSVIAPPDEGGAWDVVSLALTSTYIWIGRRDYGLFRLPAEFVSENHYFREEDLWILKPEELPMPRIVDLTEGSGDQLWVALVDEDGLGGGLSVVGQEGVNLWIDLSSLGGVPQAIDVSYSEDSGYVWVLSDSTVFVFTAF